MLKVLLDAVYLATLSWMTRYQLFGMEEYERFVSGPMTHENYKTYMCAVVNIWTLEYRHARISRKYGFALSVPFFTDELRKSVGANENIETYKGHFMESFAAIRSGEVYEPSVIS